MKKRLLLLLLVTAVLAQVASAANANPRVGKKLFDRVCRICHMPGSEAGELKPSSKTQEEWQQLIGKNKHRCDPKVLHNLTPEDKSSLVAFLKAYAADSVE
ncbi:Cytochrome c553 [Malonomonas rubra DSM 5091]|uniref:Cytochrome c553 n=1 Tax=Malonomonas rubra DSM 5091 TaxID=1122189 RepID=A0A1M6J834_MALRU|nr:cytochrome c [Malonomonas rubra]SHJ42835.1 Cytochrome c553 [Malonomonas rubra DSM 5091]